MAGKANLVQPKQPASAGNTAPSQKRQMLQQGSPQQTKFQDIQRNIQRTNTGQAPPSTVTTQPLVGPTVTTAPNGSIAPGSRASHAIAMIESILREYGISDMQSWVEQIAVDYGDSISEAEFDLEFRKTDSFKTRFKAIEERKRQGLSAISPAEVLANERQYTQVARQAGLPESFYDSPDDFVNFIVKDISPQEFQTRLIDTAVKVQNDPGVRTQMSTLYGTGATDGEVLAYFLDPDKALTAIQRRQASATIAARAAGTGFGQLSVTQAEKLAGQGVTEAQAAQGFGDLAAQRSLMNPLAGEQGSISTDEALAAQFENNAGAKAKLARRRSERQAQFSGGGSYTSDRQGYTGAGSAY